MTFQITVSSKYRWDYQRILNKIPVKPKINHQTHIQYILKNITENTIPIPVVWDLNLQTIQTKNDITKQQIPH